MSDLARQAVIDATEVGAYAFYGMHAASERYHFGGGRMEYYSVAIFKVVTKASDKGKKAERAVFRINTYQVSEKRIAEAAAYIALWLTRAQPRDAADAHKEALEAWRQWR